MPARIDVCNAYTTGVPCGSTSWTSATSALCVLSSLHSTAGVVAIHVGGVVGKGKALSFDSPVVTMLRAPNAAGSGGTTVTVLGANFGALNSSMSHRA